MRRPAGVDLADDDARGGRTATLRNVPEGHPTLPEGDVAIYAHSVARRAHAHTLTAPHASPQNNALADIIAILGMDELSEEDKAIVFRSRKMEKFTSQPFAVAEQFTGLKGSFVPLR